MELRDYIDILYNRKWIVVGMNQPVEIPKCPTCGSERIQRISPGGKVFKIKALGVFGLGNVHKIFRCLNCGYK